MSFRYVNPGYIELVTNSDCSQINIGTQPALKGEFNISLEGINKNDLYYRYDFYRSNGDIMSEISCLGNVAGNFGLDIIEGWGEEIYFCVSNRYEDQSYNIPIEYLKNDSWNSVWVHFNRGNKISGSWQDGYFELQFNDYYIKETGIEVSNYSAEYHDKNSIFSTSRRATTIANIIISDTELDKREKIIILPVSIVDTDMTNNNDGSFTATIEDQYILQTIDANSLIREFGGKSEITGINIASIPAYKTSDGLSTITGIEKSNNLITEYASTTLQTSSDSYVIMNIPVESMKIKDLAGKAYGFKVGI